MTNETSPHHPTHSLTRQYKSLGYHFTNPGLLTQALTHTTFHVEHPDLTSKDNETLEFLGDAVLDLVISALLLARFPAMTEGELTKLRSALVQEYHLSIVAQDLHLGDFLLLGKGEDQSGGRQKSSILSSTYEAVIGAIFLDSDYQTVQKIIESHFDTRIDMAQQSVALGDAKSALQELTQGRFNAAPLYILDKAEGPDHAKTFTVSVHLQGQALATASAQNKKAAEQKAAAIAITQLSQP
ncbi:MAG: ribonuclease III [Desulfobulbaceae bacterium]|nr:ribonuclease III [Desulfobulbaceae bacterium]